MTTDEQLEFLMRFCDKNDTRFFTISYHGAPGWEVCVFLEDNNLFKVKYPHAIETKSKVSLERALTSMLKKINSKYESENGE